MKPIVAIRPEPGLAATIAAGHTMGLAITGAPLFEICPMAWEPPPPQSIDALLIGSANAIRHGGQDLGRFRAKPVYAVGQATADVARAAGFAVAQVGEGGLQNVLDSGLGAATRLLRLAGAEHIALDPPADCEITTRIVYRSAELPLRADLAQRLAQGALVLLHSAAAARHFADECGRAGVARHNITLAALGPRIADAADGSSIGGWAGIHSAAQPNDLALLALAKQICQ